MGRILEPRIDEREYFRVSVRMLIRGVIAALNGDQDCRKIQLLNLWRLLYKNKVDVWHESERCIKDGIERSTPRFFPQEMTREQTADELLLIVSELYSTEGDTSLVGTEKLARFTEFLTAVFDCLDNQVVSVAS